MRRHETPRDQGNNASSSTGDAHAEERNPSTATAAAVLQSPRSDDDDDESSSSMRRRRAATTATASSAATDEASGSRCQQLQISDRRLVKLARLAASSIDWEQLQYASAAWKQKKRATIVGGGEFSITTHQEGSVHHIMASGSIACSVQEMKHVLWTTTNERHMAAMAELHGPSFLCGSAIYRINSHALASSASDQQPPSSRAERSSGFDVSVKTVTFAKAHVFARNEQWCYLDFFQPLRTAPDQDPRFTLTMHSLRAEDVLPGGNNLNPPEPTKYQLQEMTAGYSVTADPRGHFVWLSFYARYMDTDSTSTSSSNGTSRDAQAKQRKKLEASKSTAKSRLMKMAKATCFLPLIVQRRRLGAQVFANPKAFLIPPPKNKHCKCCTVALTLLVPKKRCHLCSYRVCTKCAIKQQVERAQSSKTQMVNVCTTCMQRVNAADYDDLPSGTASPACIKADDGDGKMRGKTLVDFLRNSFEKTEDAARKKALVQVARSLLESQEHDESESSFRSEGSSRRKNSSQPRHHSSVDSKRSDEETMSALKTHLHVKEYALDKCVVAHPEVRAYPIAYRDEDPIEGVTAYPIPEDEQQRVDFVAQQRLSDLKNAPELEIICAIASQELGCAAGLVTIIEKDKIHIVASNDLGYQNLVVPREESICSHMVMSDKPLLLPHPMSDIRFNKMPPVAQNGVRFYCGFPLVTGPDNTVFGSVCCVDSQSHDVTQSQYAVMMKLATTAARVMELRAANGGAGGA
ncbi:hypothetical protein Gpo141_00009804 [Globisporangium polare]